MPACGSLSVGAKKGSTAVSGAMGGADASVGYCGDDMIHTWKSSGGGGRDGGMGH